MLQVRINTSLVSLLLLLLRLRGVEWNGGGDDGLSQVTKTVEEEREPGREGGREGAKEERASIFSLAVN